MLLKMTPICPVQSCKNYENESQAEDCVLQFLDLIKLHYIHLKTELNNKESIISSLQSTNSSFNETIKKLQQEISNLSTPVKRRKTNSLEKNSSTSSSDIEACKLFGRVNFLDQNNDKTLDELNLALNSEPIFDESDVFYAANQALTSPNIEDSPSKLPLSPLENINLNRSPNKKLRSIKKKSPLKLTPTKITHFLPRRLDVKTDSAKTTSNNENKKPTSNWISTEKKNKIKGKLNRSGSSAFDGSLAFIQPTKSTEHLNGSSESIACSQDLSVKLPARKDRNILTLKPHTKMRQAKLEFDRKRGPTATSSSVGGNEQEETFCDELVAPSPITTIASTAKDRNFKILTLRKFSRKKSDDQLFNISIKKSSNETTNSNAAPITTSTPTSDQNKIKPEPITGKKSHVTNLFPVVKKNLDDPLISMDSIKDLSLISDKDETKENETSPDGKTKNSESSSVMIMPSQPDDVILIEESEENYNFEDINSMDLLEEMMRKESQTQVFLKKFENDQIRKFRKPEEKQLKFSNTEDLNVAKTNSNDTRQQGETENKQDDDVTQMNTLDQKKIFQPPKLQPAPSTSNLNTANLTLAFLGHSCQCKECNTYLRYLISQNLSKNEIIQKLQSNVKHAQRPLQLHLTPEGFWDPIMRQFSPGDPRNEVLIDTRFIDKKKTTK